MGGETFYQNHFHTFLSNKGTYWVLREADRCQKIWVFNYTWLFIGRTQASSHTRQVVFTQQLIISQIYWTLLYLKISPPLLHLTCSFTILRTPDQVTCALKFWLPRQFKDSHTPFMILTSLPHLLTDLPSCSTGSFHGSTSEPASFSVVSPQRI